MKNFSCAMEKLYKLTQADVGALRKGRQIEMAKTQVQPYKGDYVMKRTIMREGSYDRFEPVEHHKLMRLADYVYCDLDDGLLRKARVDFCLELITKGRLDSCQVWMVER